MTPHPVSPSPPTFVLCIDQGNYTISLTRGKVYRCLPDASAAEHGLVRVIDDTEEDYLFSQAMFVPIQVPAEAVAALVTEEG